MRAAQSSIEPKLLALPLAWAEEQFRLSGRRDARDLAVALISAYQGVSLLTGTFRDPSLMMGEARRLERWIDRSVAWIEEVVMSQRQVVKPGTKRVG